MRTLNTLAISFALLAITATLSAQDYSMSLEGITKVIISAETNIWIKTHDQNTILLKETENPKNANAGKTKGLKSISGGGIDNTNYGAEVTKEGSSLIVNGLRERREANLVIHLPKSMNIFGKSLANNDIYIDGFSSEIEAINHLGSIILANITGPIVAENDNGSVIVVFSQLNQLSPMSIVTSNGDIDISMPANANANITSKTLRGQLYTDFDFAPDNEIKSVANRRSVSGKLNSGGVEINLQNLKGDIYLRKLQ